MKYSLPPCLNGKTTQAAYSRWLHWRAVAHIRRDRKRGNSTATNVVYKMAIHEAVCSSGGRDAYTGEDLNWGLLSTYNNVASRDGRRKYKATFALLPTVDHVGDGLGPANFKICAWRTNDAKNDLSLEEFVALCQKVVNANPQALQ